MKHLIAEWQPFYISSKENFQKVTNIKKEYKTKDDMIISSILSYSSKSLISYVKKYKDENIKYEENIKIKINKSYIKKLIKIEKELKKDKHFIINTILKNISLLTIKKQIDNLEVYYEL